MTRARTVAVAPFAVLVDNREKAPYTFAGFVADAAQKRRPLFVPTIFATLPTGDYSIAGHEHRVAIERKSLADLYSTLGQHRDRFEREYQRLAQFEFAEVVVEASAKTVVCSPPQASRLNPKAAIRTIQKWSMKYGVYTMFAEDRRFAEIWTYWRLRDFYNIIHEKEASDEHRT